MQPVPLARRTLPGTDLELSVVGMGCWPLGGEYWGPNDEQAGISAVHTALECGINWFDTAPLYGKGHADEVLKRALGSSLHDVILATKVGARLDGLGPAGQDGHAHSDLRPAHILADCEASLRRLREPIDLLQVHWPCEWGTPLDDTLAALEDLVTRGWIRHWGLCNHDATAVRAGAARGMASLQTPYSLLRREFEHELRDACLETHTGVLVYEGLVRGLLSGKFTSLPRFPETDLRSRDDRFKGMRFGHARSVARDLQAIGERLKVPASACALGWILAQPAVTAVIAGCRTPEQVRENVLAATVADRSKAIFVIERATARHGPPR